MVRFSKYEFYNKLLGVVTLLRVTLSNLRPPNNLLLNSYFENSTFELHVLYDIDMYANFHANHMLFTI